MLAAVDITANPWRFQAHVEVWLLVASLIVLYVYMVRVVGPKAVAPGQPVVTGRQRFYFVAAMAILWGASDWPIHDIGEEYLYSVHMFQHMALTYFMPPLVLLATPEWFLRLLIGKGKAYSALRFMTKPVVAGVVFNAVVMITHIPGVVNTSVDIGPLHYGLHFLMVMASLLMWMPVCGPFRELRMGVAATMIYLFLQSVVPTIPAGWLTFAEGVVYKHYDIPVRVWGISVTNDQQIAGAIMKVGGGVFLWAIVIVLFFKRFTAGFSQEQSYRREPRVPDAEIGHVTDDDRLTFDEVSKAFASTPAQPEPEPRR